MDDSLKGIVGSRCRLIIKTNIGDNGRYFLDGMMRFPRISCERRTTACEHKVHRVDAQVEEESGATGLCYDEGMEEILAIGRARTSEARSRQATENRNTEVEGPGTGPSKHADSSETPPSVNDLYLHLHTVNHDRRHSSILDRSGSMLQSETSGGDPATPEQSVDDEAVYLNVAGESSKGRVYGLGSVGRKKRRYGTPGATTSRDADVVPRASSMSLRSNYERINPWEKKTSLGCVQILCVASSLECYDEESGRIDGERHLHAIANEFGKSIKGRFSVISYLRTCRLFFFYYGMSVEEE
ncbi:hypothetical protein Syun_006337 [Stephania yunnanensis]|uniref:Uncharacterized protein n=1 Tax=Stephania yunnanensis TaxID=152371 RepID=A0AAP0KWH8_9MAGN